VQAAPAEAISMHIVHSGEMAEEIAGELVSRRPDLTFQITPMEKFKTWSAEVGIGSPGPCHMLIVFIVSTIENAEPPESAAACIRFFNKRSQPADLLAGAKFTVLGLGDSNLLLDRRSTTAKDCNQIARQLDQRCAALGAERFHPLGEADDRTDNLEIEPWLDSLKNSLP
jgi:sulfite reductase alpha subunit-like flavoprotein